MSKRIVEMCSDLYAVIEGRISEIYNHDVTNLGVY